MSILTTGSVMDQITDALTTLTLNVKLYNSRGRTDINSDAEDFYCGLLNLVLDAELQNLNLLRMDFPAIDLADETNRICVQVTSTEERSKIVNTLEKFFDGNLKGVPLPECFSRLIVLIIGWKPDYRKDFPKQEGFTFDPAEDIWDTSRLLQEIEKLNPRRRQTILDYLKENMDLRAAAPFVLELPVPEFRTPTGFLGREEELEQIRTSKEKPIILHGLGGMGKTVLAGRYSKEWPGKVYFLRFDQSFCHTLADGVGRFLPEAERRGLEEDALADGALELLRLSGPDTLLIVDNAERERTRWSELTADPYYEKLRHLPLRLLMTTRLQDSGGIRVGSLPRQQLYGLFRGHGLELPQAEMDELIDSVDGHTMTVDLIARTLREGGGLVRPGDILTAMRNSTLARADFDEVETDHERRQRQIYGHLRELFNLSGVTEAGRKALACATLLPTTGMDGQWFLKALPTELRQELKALSKRGWVNSDNNIFTIHPVIRLVCREELKPTDEICGDFLENLRGQYDPNGAYDRVKYRQLAETFTLASRDLEDRVGNWALYAGLIWSNLGEAKLALECNQKVVQKREQTMPDSEELATAYNNVGYTYGNLGNHGKALEYKLKALAICEKVLPGDHPSLAGSYNNVGSTYGALGDHGKALEYQLKALTIREQVLPGDHPDLATSCNNVGSTYGALGNHGKALEYLLKDLAICEKVLPGDHPNLATSYNNVGLTYGALGNHGKALEYLLKDLAICEKVLPGDHPNLATSYNNVGLTYGALGNHGKALEYLLKDLAICEKVLPGDHPNLTTSYNNVGLTYGALGNHEKALEYQMKALAIREQVLPGDHPDLAQSYNNVGYTYGAFGDHGKALEYQLKALGILERALPADHPNLVDFCGNIALTYAQLDDFDRAVPHIRRAVKIADRPGQPHPRLEAYRRAAQHMELLQLAKSLGLDLPNPFK